MPDDLERISIVLASTMGTQMWDLDLPVDIPVAALIQRLTRVSELPFEEQNDAGKRNPYRILWREGDRYLSEDETLRLAGVKPNHTLIMAREARAGGPGESEAAERLVEQLAQKIAILEDIITTLRTDSAPDQSNKQDPLERSLNDRVFVVHGHNDVRKYELMRLLDRTLIRADAVILHEQTNGGSTILEKLERQARRAYFAVVLLTADDEGRLRNGGGEELRQRARQNVIFELGMFIGLLGRTRVAILKDDGIEEPSDLHGLMYITLDASGAWRYSLLKEISEAGIEVDLTRIP